MDQSSSGTIVPLFCHVMVFYY